MPYPNFHAARIADPSGFIEGAYQTQTENLPEGVSRIMGRRKGQPEGKMEPQAYRFDVKKWTAESAQAWLKERKIEVSKFEPAQVQAEADIAAAGAIDGPQDKDQPSEDEIEVLRVGPKNAAQGGRISVSLEDLKTIAASTNALIDAGAFRPPFKLGHDEDQSAVKRLFPKGGEPALGWIKRLSVKGGALIAHATGIPEKFRTWLKEGRWRTRSAELIRKYQHSGTGQEYPMVLKAVAWLGATMPADGTLKDLYQLDYQGDDQSEEIVLTDTDDDGDGLSLSDWIEGKEDGDSGGPGDATPEDQDQDGDDPPSDDIDSLSKEKRMELEKKIAEMEGTLATMSSRLDNSEKEAKAAKEAMIKSRLDRAVADGKLDPADIDAEFDTVAKLSLSDASSYLDRLEKRAVNPMLLSAGHQNEPEKKRSDEKPKIKGDLFLLEEAKRLIREKEVRDGFGNLSEDLGDGLILAASRHPEHEKELFLEAELDGGIDTCKERGVFAISETKEV